MDVKQSLSVGEVTARRSALIPHCINNGERLSKVSFPSLSIVCVQGDYAGNASPSQAVSYVAINDTRFVPATLATNFLHCYRRKLTALEGNIFSAVRKNDSSMEHAATVYMSTTISERGTHTHTHTHLTDKDGLISALKLNEKNRLAFRTVSLSQMRTFRDGMRCQQ